jgi:NADPH:quinone reductase-like Zn-dependent oxidoreductase
MQMMNAVVVHEAGSPEVLKLERRPIPKTRDGWVLIRVKAFGLNCSELFTRQGHSPNVVFPRILGIEAVGIVEAAPSGEFKQGDVVATIMSGMGRDYDGGYAEFTCVPANQVQVVNTELPWEVLGALPEMLQTAWGALFKSLRIDKGDRLLIRGGTTSVGLAAAAILKSSGVHVAATTRNPESEKLLRDNGAAHVFIDSGTLEDQVKTIYPDGVDKVLELVGTKTLLDSLRCVNSRGIVSMVGIVGNEWTLNGFNPMEGIPSNVCLTSYSGTAQDFIETPLNDLARQIAAGTLPIRIGRTFRLEEIVEAHRFMESNQAVGKIVVLT